MKIIAHRGFSAEYPENSKLAFEKAVENGFNKIELDVHLTKDREVVVLHDHRVTGRLFSNFDKKYENIAIHEISWSELSALDYEIDNSANSRKAYPRTKSKTHVSKLEEVLQIGKELNVEWHIEIKYLKKNSTNRSALVDVVYETVSKTVGIEKVIFYSFDVNSLRLIRMRSNQARINFLYQGIHLFAGVYIPRWKKCRQIVESLRADVFAPHYKLLQWYPSWKKFFARELRNCELYVWTVNDPNALESELLNEIDAVITDEPVKLRESL